MKTAVIAMAYGSPTSIEEVPAYLQDVRGGRPARPEIVEELAERYRRIGGVSPLAKRTEAQRAALERELGVPVYVGMKHSAPRIADAVQKAIEGGAERLVGLVLAPHYSRMSIGEYRHRVESSLNGAGVELRFIESWGSYRPFVDVLASRVRGTGAHVVFTAHSLPARILADDDPYRDQLLETARLVAERAGLDPEHWSFAFQSESPTGEPWLGPDILAELDRLRAQGVDAVRVAPIGFVADHLEILWDLDIVARERADQLGLRLERTPSLNDDPEFIRALADLVRREVDS